MHGINVLCTATESLNPGQIAIALMLQLLVLIKFIQGNWPETIEKDRFIAMCLRQMARIDL